MMNKRQCPGLRPPLLALATHFSSPMFTNRQPSIWYPLYWLTLICSENWLLLLATIVCDRRFFHLCTNTDCFGSVGGRQIHAISLYKRAIEIERIKAIIVEQRHQLFGTMTLSGFIYLEMQMMKIHPPTTTTWICYCQWCCKQSERYGEEEWVKVHKMICVLFPNTARTISLVDFALNDCVCPLPPSYLHFQSLRLKR